MTQILSPVEWGVACRPLAGGPACGDGHLVKPVAGGLLVAVVDGLGHGEKAAAATAAAIRTLARCARGPIEAMASACDSALTGTRGAALGVAFFDETRQTATWLSVGDVAGVVLRAGGPRPAPPQYLIPHRGVVGYRFPPVRASSIALEPGDLLILATDGIARGFEEELSPRGLPQRLADEILERHALAIDDALVLVVRWRGWAYG